MAEDIKITCHVKNETGNQLTISDQDLSWGKWKDSPDQIDMGKEGSWKACGRQGSASGTEGYVTYIAYDKTTFTIDFSINWGGKANSISNKTEGENPTHFTFIRTKKDFKTRETSGDPGGSPVEVYYLIQKNT